MKEPMNSSFHKAPYTKFSTSKTTTEIEWLRELSRSTVEVGQLDLHKGAAPKVLYKRSNYHLLSLDTLYKAFYKQNS